MAKIADLLATVGAGRWQTWRAAYRRQAQASELATLVIGRGRAVSPPPQMGPADRRRREARATRPAQPRCSKGARALTSTDRAWALLSTEPTWRAALSRYSGRCSTEGADRDWKSWEWEAVVGQATPGGLVDGITGLAALGAIMQAALGAAAGRTQEVGAGTPTAGDDHGPAERVRARSVGPPGPRPRLDALAAPGHGRPDRAAAGGRGGAPSRAADPAATASAAAGGCLV